MFAIMVSFITKLQRAFPNAYDRFQQLLVVFYTLPLNPMASLSLLTQDTWMNNTKFFAILPEGNGSPVAVPSRLHPSVRLSLAAIRALKVSGHQSSPGIAVNSVMLRIQQTLNPTNLMFPQNARNWRQWLRQQEIRVIFTPGSNSSCRWGWITKAPGTEANFCLCILHELADIASQATLDPGVYPLPVPFYRFVTLVIVMRELVHLITKHAFPNQLIPVSNETLLRFGDAGLGFEQALFGGCLAAEWTSTEHVGEFAHLHGLYLRHTATGEDYDYALSLEDVTAFIAILVTAGEDMIIPSLPLAERRPSTPKGSRVRTLMMKTSAAPAGSLLSEKIEEEVTKASTRIRIPVFH